MAEHDHHDHGHGHARHRHGDDLKAMATQNRRRLLVVLVGGVLVMTAEIVGGLMANSLVLLADAAHYATDVLAVAIAFFAVGIGLRPATARHTFGYPRAEVLAAFVNALALWGVSGIFLYEAWMRLRSPPEVQGPLVMIVGGFTLVANAGLALLLHRGSGHNINVRAAYLHILSDVLGSAGALAAGAAVHFFGWHVADPLVTIFITILILAFTWRLTRDTLRILLEGVPVGLDAEEVERAIRGVARVKDVHDLHVWSLTSGRDVLSVHVVLDEKPQNDHVTHDIHRALMENFRIDHVTVQVEDPDCPCEGSRCARDGAA